MSADQLLRSGLTGAVLSDKAVDGPDGDGHVQPVQGVQSPEGLLQSSYFNGIHNAASFKIKQLRQPVYL